MQDIKSMFMIEIIAYSFLIMLASLVGVFSIWKRASALIEKNMRFLVSFSAGVLIVVSYKLADEAMTHAESATNGLIWIFAGAIGVLLLFKILPSFHHHHDECEEKNSERHSKIEAGRIMISDGIHNIGDGILLASSFAIGSSVGIATALGILVHEIMQEISEFFVLRQAGYSTRKALGLNFLVSSTILFGSLGSFFLLEQFEMLEIPLLGLAAGSFLLVVFHDLIPSSISSSSHKIHYLKHIAWFCIGIIAMIGTNMITANTHNHELKHDEIHEEKK